MSHTQGLHALGPFLACSRHASDSPCVLKVSRSVSQDCEVATGFEGTCSQGRHVLANTVAQTGMPGSIQRIQWCRGRGGRGSHPLSSPWCWVTHACARRPEPALAGEGVPVFFFFSLLGSTGSHSGALSWTDCMTRARLDRHACAHNGLHHHHHHHQASRFKGCSQQWGDSGAHVRVECVCVFPTPKRDPGSSAARRRREQRLRSFLCHERMAVVMSVAEERDRRPPQPSGRWRSRR